MAIIIPLNAYARANTEHFAAIDVRVGAGMAAVAAPERVGKAGGAV